MPFEPAENARESAPHGVTPVVRWLLAVNIAVYFLQLTIVSTADVRSQLGFEIGNIDAWWTVATYAVVHGSLWHLALSAISLWYFGPRVEQRWGSGQFVGYYLLCALGGWFFHLLFVRQGILIGSSAALLGVMVAYASRWPSETVLLFGIVPVTVRWLVALMVVANLLVGIGTEIGTGAAYLAHVGGLVTGWAYLRMAGSMDLERLRQRIAPIADEPDDMPHPIPPRSLPRQRSERDPREVDEIVQQSQAAIAERTANSAEQKDLHGPSEGVSRRDLNALLDKISAHGLDALSQAERTRLEDAARRLKKE
jgi:membrane associated rhomboid family serine protease